MGVLRMRFDRFDSLTPGQAAIQPTLTTLIISYFFATWLEQNKYSLNMHLLALNMHLLLLH